MVDAEAASRSARATIEELAGTLADEHLGQQFRTRAVARLPVQSTNDSRPARDAQFSPREQEVLHLLIEGKSDRDIAEALCISPLTVMRHVTGILNKLGVSSRTAAATQALRRNLI